MGGDVLFIKGLEVEALIGAYDWEREVLQKLVFNVEMPTDIAAARSDALGDVLINYNSVAVCIREFVSASNFELLEALADRLVAVLQDEFSPDWIRLTIEKPRPETGYTAGLIIERSRER